MTTLRERFESATTDLTNQGITWVLDTEYAEDRIASCTRVTENISGRLATAWVKGGRWDRDNSTYLTGSYRTVEWLLISYTCEDVKLGRLITKAFRRYGFEVIWDGRPTSAVDVRLA